jgi:short-subunit dehydrogenase
LNSLIVGASAGVGRALAGALAKKGHHLFLVASDGEDLKALSSDLHIRYGVKVEWEAVDLSRLDAPQLKHHFFEKFGELDNLFLIAGLSNMNKDFAQLDPDEAHRLMQVNFEAPVALSLAFLEGLKERPSANLVGIGTVASARGRSQNTVYAAAKRGCEFFFEGLAQSLADSALNVQFYRFGFIDTSMNTSEGGLIPKWSPEKTAEAIVANLGKEIPMAYLPSWWRWIMLVFRSIPWFLFRKMG